MPGEAILPKWALHRGTSSHYFTLLIEALKHSSACPAESLTLRGMSSVPWLKSSLTPCAITTRWHAFCRRVTGMVVEDGLSCPQALNCVAEKAFIPSWAGWRVLLADSQRYFGGRCGFPAWGPKCNVHLTWWPSSMGCLCGALQSPPWELSWEISTHV